MVDPDPIREPVEETFEEGELTPIIMAQATVHPRPVDVGEGSSGRKTKRKRRNKESYQAAKARTTNNHYIRHACLGEAPESSSVIPEVRLVKLASPASYMPGFIELKDDIAIREKLIAKLRTALTEAIAGFRGDLILANESIAKRSQGIKLRMLTGRNWRVNEQHWQKQSFPWR
ncbi:hypothetical protein R1sor_025145 [Riccia sorocarpa]|uniref:Uncharacterized protein n=1 Tax=Riccia sorocarpa TaxID=122646 RepID=A0ABD3G7R0_9MARC